MHTSSRDHLLALRFEHRALCHLITSLERYARRRQHRIRQCRGKRVDQVPSNILDFAAELARLQRLRHGPEEKASRTQGGEQGAAQS